MEKFFILESGRCYTDGYYVEGVFRSKKSIIDWIKLNYPNAKPNWENNKFKLFYVDEAANLFFRCDYLDKRPLVD